MIALGLSLLFGMGWAFGLLASSDLPPAVRYPTEWIFTLMAAFLGVYLFALYVLRPQEARKAWKRWLFCQCKRNFSNAGDVSAIEASTVLTAPDFPVEVEMVNIVDQDRKCNKENANPTPISPSDLKASVTALPHQVPM